MRVIVQTIFPEGLGVVPKTFYFPRPSAEGNRMFLAPPPIPRGKLFELLPK